jgi:histidinol phosphatase-like enzyme (inositol monophosphatase family)
MNPAETLQLDGRFGFAVEIARRAGEQTLALFRAREFGLERKADGSPVTQADRDAETLLRQLIGERFPEDGILGEEFGETPGTSGYRWILDPIDGTKSFVAGVPLYTTLVAVLRDERPEIGVICAPAAGEMVFAELAKGCWHAIGDDPPRRARVSIVAELSDAVFVTTAVEAFSTGRERDARRVVDELAAVCRVTRTWGDAFGYLLVATGRAEVMIDPVMNLWDAAALAPVIEEAGGRFCDWRGQPTVHSGEAVATNGALAEEVLRILAPHG